MAKQTAAWGIEIGSYAIKALRLERDGGNVAVSDFAVIPHKKVLTSPDLDRDEMVRLSLGQFISQKDLEGEHLVMSVPGHAAFARFAKLPPVDPKKVPDIVKFEAVQQIPFPIDQVEWDYQTFTIPDSPEIEVGIFAMTRERVQQVLGLYGDVGLSPESLTLSPVALFNAMAYDQDLGKHPGPVVFLDIGTQATDVVIAEEGRCWIRTFPLGGHHFTEAISGAFKVSYSKAEKLKLEASTSKYAKQIMQAMRPVFSDLLQDLQRSIGYYQTVHRDRELSLMVGLGSTFKIPGLRKFLGQQLQINVLRLDEFKRISMRGREAASFAEHAVNMGTAYGLALQGVGLAGIDANLVPVKILREQMWHSKTKWFAAAAAVAVIGSTFILYRPIVDRAALQEQEPAIVARTISRGTTLKREYDSLRAEGATAGATANFEALLAHRDIWIHLVRDTAAAIQSAGPQPELLGSDLDAILAIEPQQRRLIELQNLDGTYRFDAAGGRRIISVALGVRLSHRLPDEFLSNTVARWLRENADRPQTPYRILPETISINPGRIQSVVIGADGQTPQPGPGERRPGLPSPDPSPSPEYSPPPSPHTPGRRMPGGPGGPMPGPMPGPAPGPGPAPTPVPSPRSPESPSQRRPAEQPRIPLDINQLAPIPDRPAIYPIGAVVYMALITFEVELRDAQDTSDLGQDESQDPYL
jgi:type IV pilus assembly protein PilM